MGDYEDFIALSRYARWLPEDNRRETWEETVNRYVDEIVSPVNSDVSEEVRNAITNLEVMPSMRALMVAGKASERDNTCVYNCAYLPVDDPKSFDEAMFILLCGTGVGFSVERQYVSKLPSVPNSINPVSDILIVDDSKEGWALAYRELLRYLWSGKVPKWDTSKVRPSGAKLETFGGRASGPAPLVDLFEFTISAFKKAASRKLTSIECHDIMCKIGEIVVVGGVRRSAMISLSNPSDDRMRHAKSGQWWVTDPQRALANNSTAYSDKPDIESFTREWLSLMESKSGERGIFNREAAKLKAGENGRRNAEFEFGVNPCCVSGETEILTDLGYERISEVVGVPVNIWNGESWEKVTPYETGEADLVRVTLSDGKYLDCTWNHRWCIGGEFIETKNLVVGLDLDEFEIPNENTYPAWVVNIEPLDRFEMTYCFTEPKTSRGTFNGIVTGNSEIILRPYQFCNLTEVVCRSEDTLDSLKEKVRIATILGTIQSTYTYFPYLRDIWKENTDEERLLGVSLTGIMDCPLINENCRSLESVLRTLKQVAIDTNKEWAEKLGIPQSTATTCVKPSGTVSQRVNSASGIHQRHSPFYIRTVRGDNKDPLTQFMIAMGVPNEPCVMKPETTTVFSFPQKSPENAKFRSDFSAIKQLEIWLTYQRHWCEHKPSVTISVKDDEWLEVGAWVYKHFDEVSGVSFLPYSDHSYNQAPYQECTEAEYEKMLARMPDKINWSELSYFESDDTTKSSQTYACTGSVCEVVDI